MVVGYNEEKLLPACLSSLLFCDEIFYTDLGSSDTSIEVASTFTDKILVRKKVPAVEFIQTEVVKYLKNDWVLFIDPDEVIDKILAQQVMNNFLIWTADDNIGAIEVPWQFYFKKYKLKGTVWGGINRKFLLVNKNRFEFKPIAHYGRTVLPDYQTIQIAFDGGSNILHHFWMNSWFNFFNKHFRYLKKEGLDQYNQGVRFAGYTNLLKTPYTEFRKSFFLCNGYRDGVIGFFLSVFWAIYQTKIKLSLLKISIYSDHSK